MPAPTGDRCQRPARVLPTGKAWKYLVLANRVQMASRTALWRVVRHALARAGGAGAFGSIRRVGLIAALLATSVRPLTGQHAVRADTALLQPMRAGSPPRASHRQSVALGGALLLTLALTPFDRRLQRATQSHDLQECPGLQGSATALAFAGGPGPFVASGMLYLSGRAARVSSLADLGVHLMEGVTLAATIGALGKGIAGRALPNATTDEPGEFAFGRGFRRNNGAFVSFPSGHTAAAFASAAVLTDEAERWRPGLRRVVAPVAYAGAVLIGVSRIYQNVHWASDLPLAALIGIWSGRAVVRRQHHGARHRMDEWLLGTTITPGVRGALIVRWSSSSASAAP